MQRISKKYSFSAISMVTILASVPFILKIDEIAKMESKYQLIACLTIPLMILVITVSYLTGQAKIDVSARLGGNDEEKD